MFKYNVNNISKIANCNRNLSTYVCTSGCGLFGALGMGNDFQDSKHFRIVPIKLNGKSSQISASWSHTVFTTTTGEVCLFGRPYEFQPLLLQYRFYAFSKWLGRMMASMSDRMDGGGSVFPSPTLIENYDGQNIIKVVSSAALTVSLTQSGLVYVFGNNRWGQCAVDTDKEYTFDKYMKAPLTIVFYQPVLAKLIQHTIIDIDAGFQHVLALTSTGQVYAWGKCTRGQLGIKEEVDFRDQKSPNPAIIPSLQNITAIAAGFTHSAAIDSDGYIYVWGKNMSTIKRTEKGEISILTYHDAFQPRRFSLPDGRKAVNIISSNHTVLIQGDDHTLWVIGLGENDRNMVHTPIPVQTIQRHYEIQIIDEIYAQENTFSFKKLFQSASTTSFTSSTVNADSTASTSSTNTQLNDTSSTSNILNTADNIQYVDPSKYFKFTPNMRLKKGHQRILILEDIICDSNSNSDNNNNHYIANVYNNKQATDTDTISSHSSTTTTLTTTTKSSSSSSSSSSPYIHTKVYEIRLQDFEAYIMPIEIQFDSLENDFLKHTGGNYRIKDYTSGWLHSAMIIEQY